MICSPIAAEAAVYGSPVACEALKDAISPEDEIYGFVPDLAGPEDDPRILLTDADLLGVEFGCDLSSAYNGRVTCDGEGETWIASLHITKTAAAAVIVIDGKTYTLPRCK